MVIVCTENVRKQKTEREERIPTRCNNIDDLLSVADIDY